MHQRHSFAEPCFIMTQKLLLLSEAMASATCISNIFYICMLPSEIKDYYYYYNIIILIYPLPIDSISV